MCQSQETQGQSQQTAGALKRFCEALFVEALRLMTYSTLGARISTTISERYNSAPILLPAEEQASRIFQQGHGGEQLKQHNCEPYIYWQISKESVERHQTSKGLVNGYA